jgi:hypothetical protein
VTGDRLNKLITTARQAPEDPAWLGGVLGAPSFAVMRTLLIAAMGEPLTAAECDLQAAARKRRPKPLRNFGSSRSFFIGRSSSVTIP